MRNVMKNVAAGTVIGGSLLFTAGLGIATAQPETAPDGLVNVSLGNAGVLEDVKAADAAQITRDRQANTSSQSWSRCSVLMPRRVQGALYRRMLAAGNASHSCRLS